MQAFYFYIQMIKYVKPINLTSIIPQAPESILCAKLCSSDILSKNTHPEQGEDILLKAWNTRSARGTLHKLKGRREKETNTSKEQSTLKGLFQTLKMPVSLFVGFCQIFDKERTNSGNFL